MLEKVTVKAKKEERAELTTELQQTKEQLSDVTQQLTSLRGKTCTLIGMLNDVSCSSGDSLFLLLFIILQVFLCGKDS